MTSLARKIAGPVVILAVVLVLTALAIWLGLGPVVHSQSLARSFAAVVLVLKHL